ncbi:hypothetical protein A3A70_03295 [candidate division WWE3 bacterium RIFCSPLOWO2_01_FULL_42_11]|uniref:HAD family hydrolase n=1 Tax=candidate division WWE3 bacterium RIFCSPLOWO2_01_FULL_42_11 TaxID=1802627 RepID=A0A1F4VMS1_UNCKA|nr:MAG: hypothetical protein A3A70_03295 [candidate division WWE3 bacterium RIFCSPLOWO2_01_FULL_42_11]
MIKRIGKDIKAVIFDYDDTLVESIRPVWAKHKFIAKKYYGKNLEDEEIRIHWGKPFAELVQLLYETEDSETALAHNYNLRGSYSKLLYEESIPTLTLLKDKGKLLGIVTANNRYGYEYDLTQHNIPSEVIDYSQTADETSFHKPDPRVFDPAILWLTEQQIQPHQVLYIGDGLHDMKASLGAGFHFIGVQTGLIFGEEFKVHDAFSVPTIADIADLID